MCNYVTKQKWRLWLGDWETESLRSGSDFAILVNVSILNVFSLLFKILAGFINHLQRTGPALTTRHLPEPHKL